jgi:hypothetical protein
MHLHQVQLWYVHELAYTGMYLHLVPTHSMKGVTCHTHSLAVVITLCCMQE